MSFECTLYIVLSIMLATTYAASPSIQTQFFKSIKSSLSGDALSNWDVNGKTPYCNFTGVACDSQGYVERINMAGWGISGRFPTFVCTYLPKLRFLSLSENNFHGDILHSILNCSLLEELHASYATTRGGTLADFSSLRYLRVLDISNNFFTGDFPMSIANLINLEHVNIGWNSKLDSWELPKMTNISSLKKLKSMLLYRSNLHGPISAAIGNLTALIELDLSYNFMTGVIPAEIGEARNLSKLFLQSNKISGVLPPHISEAVNLVEISVSNNLISGAIPNSFSFFKKLKVLDLSKNSLTGNVPESLSLVSGFLDLSSNHFSGPIPMSMIYRVPLGSFAGNPRLCVPIHILSDPNFPICSRQNRLNPVIPTLAVITFIGLVLFLTHIFCRKGARIEQDTTIDSYDVKRFHQISIDHREIIQGIVDTNIIGRGGSGTVYRIDLSNNEVVAVKKLTVWQHSTSLLDKLLESEIETLGLIRHCNIVKLYSIISSPRSKMLVYEYMPNGNLWEALHTPNGINLNWPSRHRIALGVAQGLSYLHHNLSQPIIHRDIKSTNILLDHHYQSKVADFGLARILRSGGEHSTATLVAGTFGYLAPEYAYTAKASTKCDVYSFGVVLLELVTGKKPVEEEFGEGRNIIHWASSKVTTDEGITEALDLQFSGSFRNEMLQVFWIAYCCTLENPALRPNMKQVVQLLATAQLCSV